LFCGSNSLFFEGAGNLRQRFDIAARSSARAAETGTLGPVFENSLQVQRFGKTSHMLTDF
jgi:hypothetical protein